MTNEQSREQLTAMFGAYSQRLERLYDNFVDKLSIFAKEMGVDTEDYLKRHPLFAFETLSPELKREFNSIFSDYVQREILAYRAGITDGVALAYTHSNDVLTGFSVLSNKALSQARKTAADAFIRNRLKGATGLNLSHLVWNYSSQAKSEFEVAISNVISDGLKKGTSAASLGLKVRQYLNNPDMMYRRYHRTVVDAQGNKKDIVKWRRRIIDDKGKVRFVEQPLEKVGTGQYRSARKNSERLMRTEINMAYHRANSERWQKEPFVTGILVELSPQHPRYDMCDELQGRYPKDFKFLGWHPSCLCSASPITLQGDEKKEFYRRLMAGEDMSNYHSPFEVKDIPDEAKAWIEENREKFIRAGEQGKLGYVWRENMKYVGKQFSQEELSKMGYVPQRTKRIKTEAEKADIQKRWDERKKTNEIVTRGNAFLDNLKDFPQIDTTELKEAVAARDAYRITSAVEVLRPRLKFERSITPHMLLDSVMRKKYGNEAIDALYANTTRTIKNKVTGTSIDDKIKQLRFEAEWVVKNRSFATVKEVAAYYEREAVRLEAIQKFDTVRNEIMTIERNLSKYGIKTVLTGKEWYGDISALEAKLKGLEAYKIKFERIAKIEKFAENSKSPIVHSLLDSIKYTLEQRGVDASVESLLAEAEQNMARLEKEAMRRAKKAAEKAAEEAKKKMESLYGKNISVEDLVITLGKNCPESIKNLQPIIDKYESIAESKYTREEILRFKAGMKEMFAKFDFGMNIEAQWLENCMDDWFKNLIEVGHGNGSTNIPNRVNAAKDMFGFGNISKGKKMEKYGSLIESDIAAGFQNNSASSYGECMIRFKKDKVIATWTGGDSLGLSYQPSLTTDPKLSSLARRVKKDIPDFSQINSVQELKKQLHVWDYIELQYHGDLTFDCVESVAFNSQKTANAYKHLIPRIKAKNIKVYYYDRQLDKAIEL